MASEKRSKGVRLLAAGVTLSLPADGPYDHQLLVESVSALLKRHGAVRLSSGRRAWWLTLTAGSVSSVCAHCLRPLERAVQFNGGEVTCVGCASRSVISAHMQGERSAA